MRFLDEAVVVPQQWTFRTAGPLYPRKQTFVSVNGMSAKASSGHSTNVKKIYTLRVAILDFNPRATWTTR